MTDPPEKSLVGVIFPTEGQFAANSNADFIIDPDAEPVNTWVGSSSAQCKAMALISILRNWILLWWC
jgi:hypothetical protein